MYIATNPCYTTLRCDVSDLLTT